MATHLIRDLEHLKREILILGGMVEEAVEKSITALTDRRTDLAEEVQLGDRVVDEREVQVEEECLKILALHQPVAADLRYVVAVMKVNNDLERVGDLARNIAERAAFLAGQRPVPVPPGITAMAAKACEMLRNSLNALVSLDTALARQVHRDDEQVDATHRQLYKVFEDRIRSAPDRIDVHLHMQSVSRYLERIADLATNIAEDVIFMVDGDVIRHKSI